MKWSLSLLVGCALCTTSWSGTEMQEMTLSGIRGVCAVVEQLDPQANKDGLDVQTLASDMEAILHDADITVIGLQDYLEGAEKASLDIGLLYLDLGTIKRQDGLYAVYISLQLKQPVRLARPAARPSQEIPFGATTWTASETRIGLVEASQLPRLRGAVREMTEEFADAYLRANGNHAP